MVCGDEDVAALVRLGCVDVVVHPLSILKSPKVLEIKDLHPDRGKTLGQNKSPADARLLFYSFVKGTKRVKGSRYRRTGSVWKSA